MLHLCMSPQFWGLLLAQGVETSTVWLGLDIARAPRVCCKDYGPVSCCVLGTFPKNTLLWREGCLG